MEAAVATRRGGTVRFVALEQQHAHIEHELKDAFARLLQSSAYTLGVEVERFEAEFAEYSEARHCVGVASGTAALSLMLEAYGIGPGDEVVVPAHTFIASALAVAHVGATPVLCEVIDGTGLIDPDAARAAVGPRTAAILAVHLYGQACDIGALDAFAKPAGLLVLEDAAQAHGARYRGRRVGSLGAAAAFSFYPSKNLGALGRRRGDLHRRRRARGPAAPAAQPRPADQGRARRARLQRAPRRPSGGAAARQAGPPRRMERGTPRARRALPATARAQREGGRGAAGDSERPPPVPREVREPGCRRGDAARVRHRVRDPLHPRGSPALGLGARAASSRRGTQLRGLGR